MNKKVSDMTVDEMNKEIERLKKSEYVKLARKTENDMLRQKIYSLRSLEKKGRRIAAGRSIDAEGILE